MRAWISASESETGATVATAGAGVRGAWATAAGAAGRVTEKTINAAESMAAEAKPRRAPEFHRPVQARRHGDGSKMASETKDTRCGISSSRRLKRAAW